MTEDSNEIINLLREVRLGWIADELIESLALGRQSSKDFHEPGMARATRATTITPFIPEEEMELIIETLAQYFIVMPKAWKLARERFAKKDTFAKIDVGEESIWSQSLNTEEEQVFSTILGIQGDGAGHFHDFDTTFENQLLPTLRGLLRELWPKGVNDFERRFTLEEP